MRPALIILIHLLLGLLIAVGLALVSSRWRPSPSNARTSPIWRSEDGQWWAGLEQFGPGWSDVTLYGLGGTITAAEEFVGKVPRWIELPTTTPHGRRAVRAIAAGWPAPALRSWRHGQGDDSPGPGGVIRTGLGPQRVIWADWNGGLPLETGNTPGVPPVIPLSPVAAGLIIDVLVWGALSVVVWLVPLGRVFVRRRRNRCAHCGYPRSGSPCPECGM